MEAKEWGKRTSHRPAHENKEAALFSRLVWFSTATHCHNNITNIVIYSLGQIERVLKCCMGPFNSSSRATRLEQYQL
jgi:hypothetical protein